jgi:hypothetical protein
MNRTASEQTLPALPMTNYWVVPAWDANEAFHCCYYDNGWTRLVTGALDCKGPTYAADFLSLVFCDSPPPGVPPLPAGYTVATNVDLVGAVARTLSPRNILQESYGTVQLAGTDGSPSAGLVLPVIAATHRGVILVFAVNDAFGNVLGLVASKDPEIKNSTGIGSD